MGFLATVRMRSLLAVFLAAIGTNGAASEARAPATVSGEYQLKAAFLFRFMQFIEWPETAFVSSDTPLCVGVLGADPFGDALDEVLRNEAVERRAVVVRRSQRVEELKDCHLVFISRSEKAKAADILSGLSARPTVTVSEVEGFARLGGVINFFLEGKKLRFEINPTAARRNGLRVSSQLLSLGKIVEPEPREGQ